MIILKIFADNAYHIIKNEFIDEKKRNRSNSNMTLMSENNSQN